MLNNHHNWSLFESVQQSVIWIISERSISHMTSELFHQCWTLQVHLIHFCPSRHLKKTVTQLKHVKDSSFIHSCRQLASAQLLVHPDVQIVKPIISSRLTQTNGSHMGWTSLSQQPRSKHLTLQVSSSGSVWSRAHMSVWFIGIPLWWLQRRPFIAQCQQTSVDQLLAN